MKDDAAVLAEVTEDQVQAPIAETPGPEPVADKTSLRDQIAQNMKAIQDRPRDDAGRFAPTKAEQAAQAQTAQAPATQQPAVAIQPKAERPGDMPKAWGADKAAYWSTLTPEAKAYITERETQMEGFHTKFGGLNQWHEAAQANGTSLPEVLDRVSKVENTMISDPSQGLIMAGDMVGMSREDTARALVGALQKLGYQIPGVQQSQNVQAALPPEFDQLAQRLNGIEQTFQQQAISKAQAQVDEFFANPANEHAQALQDEIAQELRAMKAIGKPMDLKTAYDRALWTRPDLREKLVAKQIADKQAQEAAARTQELAKSRSAARSVAGTPPRAEGRSSADRPTSLRDEIAMRVRTATGRT